jgi:uncharacterized protein (TIGR02145 family)
MKTNYLTLFFIVATFAIILTLFYFITKDVFYYPSKIKAGNKIDEVIIGDQVWKSTNLDLDTFRNGDLIPHVESDEAWKKAGENQQPAWCYYDNSSEYGEKYGKLYNWFAVNDPRGLAPEGFHIPTDNEWISLTSFLGGESISGGKMKIKGITFWQAPNVGATNESGFSALPGGDRGNDGSFTYITGCATFWTATEIGTNHACGRYLYNWSGGLQRANGFNDANKKSSGASVRCVKD